MSTALSTNNIYTRRGCRKWPKIRRRCWNLVNAFLSYSTLESVGGGVNTRPILVAKEFKTLITHTIQTTVLVVPCWYLSVCVSGHTQSQNIGKKHGALLYWLIFTVPRNTRPCWSFELHSARYKKDLISGVEDSLPAEVQSMPVYPGCVWRSFLLQTRFTWPWSLLVLGYAYDNTGLQKKIPGMSFQDSVRFSPAEYEYESRFFPLRPDFPKFYDKDININKVGCL